MVKNLPAMQETRVRSLGQEDPWRRKRQPTAVFLPGYRSPGPEEPAGYSPRGRRELDTTQQLNNGTPSGEGLGARLDPELPAPLIPGSSPERLCSPSPHTQDTLLWAI